MIIFLNGSIHAGKSTVARLLARELPRTALVEPDVFHEMIEWMPIDEAVPLNLTNAVAAVRTFASKGLNVIVPYPLSEKNWKFISDALRDMGGTVHAFTLAPKMEVALSKRGDRELTDEEKARIEHHYAIGIPRPSFGEIIDNSEQTPEETARAILAKLRN